VAGGDDTTTHVDHATRAVLDEMLCVHFMTWASQFTPDYRTLHPGIELKFFCTKKQTLKDEKATAGYC
jgi:hypothetical protein